MPRSAISFVATCLSLAAGGFGCLDLQVPERAQITCDVDQPRCPRDWECCDGLCQQQCRCEIGGCDMNFAIDCVEQRLCVDGCWQDCPTCQARCSDPKLKSCFYTGTQGEWFCRRRETCLVRVDEHGGMSADCHTPPPFCQGDDRQRCQCIDGPGVLYPPCGPYEACRDISPLCVSCQPKPEDRPDAAAHFVDGGVDRMDAGILIAPQDGSPEPWDASNDRGGQGGGPGLDHDADTSTDGGEGVSRDSDAPTCFLPLGGNSLGELCCESNARPAHASASSWACDEGWSFAPQCDGFGEACFSQTQPRCAASESCLWSWAQNGQLQCADYGPAAPCVEGAWQCYTGTSAPERCDCVTPNCP